MTIQFYIWEPAEPPKRGGGKARPHHVWNIWQAVISEAVFLGSLYTSPCLPKWWESEKNIALNMRRTSGRSGPLHLMLFMEHRTCCGRTQAKRRQNQTDRWRPPLNQIVDWCLAPGLWDDPVMSLGQGNQLCYVDPTTIAHPLPWCPGCWKSLEFPAHSWPAKIALFRDWVESS